MVGPNYARREGGRDQEVELAEEQKAAVVLLLERIRSRDRGRVTELVLGGRAGTGKTTLLRYLCRELEGGSSAEADAIRVLWSDRVWAARDKMVLMTLDADDQEKWGKIAALSRSAVATPGERATCEDRLARLEERGKESGRADNKNTAYRSAALHYQTVLRQLNAEIEKSAGKMPVVLGAPVGKAAQRMREVLGRSASTLHRLIYAESEDGPAGPVFGSPGPAAGPNELLVVDEATMVGSDVHRDLVGNLAKGSCVLYSCDTHQLFPVKAEVGPPVLAPTVVLKQIHRQALDNPIVRASIAVSERQPLEQAVKPIDAPWIQLRRTRGATSFDEAVWWLVERRRKDVDAILVANTNATRITVNMQVRNLLGRTKPLEVGDRLICGLNNHTQGVMNGEAIEVHELTAIEEIPGGYEVFDTTMKRPVFVFAPLLGLGNDAVQGFKRWRSEKLARRPEEDVDDPWSWRWQENWILADHAQCITVHKSQGSQWREVGIIHERSVWGMRNKSPDDYWRWLYTALTRAIERTVVWL